jgi:hypothetical protein
MLSRASLAFGQEEDLLLILMVEKLAIGRASSA